MLTVTLINTLVVILVVIIHYECLLRLNDWLPRLKLWSRFRIVNRQRVDPVPGSYAGCSQRPTR